MIQKPVQIKQSLGNHVLIQRSFVLDNDGRAILVNSHGINSAAMRSASRVFRGEKTDPQKFFHMLFNQSLKGFFNSGRSPLQLVNFMIEPILNNFMSLMVGLYPKAML